MATATKSDELLVCRESFVDVAWDGQRYIAGVTLVAADDQIFKRNPSWRKFFEPAKTERARIEQATANPGEVRF